MAKRQDGGIRLRPVGTRKHRQNAPAYSPAGTGCPAFEQAVENLYKGQNEESCTVDGASGAHGKG